MAVYINTVAGEPEYASLPAAKIVLYPLEGRDYRPYAQVQLALSPDSFYVRMIAFEADPAPDSEMLFVLDAPDTPLALSAGAPGGVRATGCALLPDLEARRTGGEDLQGIYWGVAFAIPVAAVSRIIGHSPAVGGALRGNAFKLGGGQGGARHCGMLFPSRPVWSAADARLLSAEDFGPMQVVGY